MAQTNGAAKPRFRVDMLGLAGPQLRAIAFDRPAADVVGAFRTILRRLQLDPREEGEPLYHFAKLHMTSAGCP